MTMRDPINIGEIEAQARTLLTPSVYDYCAGGSGDEVTLRENRAAFDRLMLRPRVLVDVSVVDTIVELLGVRLSLPLLLAPTALNRLAHPDGELAAGRAAATCGVAMVVSTFASYLLEDIAAAGRTALWFQTYVFRDRGLTADLIGRADGAGYRAIVLTADTPRLGRRERDMKNAFILPADVMAPNLVARDTIPSRVALPLANLQQLPDASLTWRDISWLRGRTTLPILIKGILGAEDARRAALEGLDGIIVSNHGGRQLDGALSAIDALPAVVNAVEGQMPVLIDGGIRRGTDMLKAIALGARAVLIGRPYLWGLAVDGEAGVRRVIEMLREELTLAMALSGCPSIATVNRSTVCRLSAVIPDAAQP
jgi:4-hydroxymandelate oxidase